MNRRHILVIGLVILIFILAVLRMCKIKNFNFEGFGNIVVSKKPAETHIVKFVQPKQTDLLNITTSDGNKFEGAIAYKVEGTTPNYQKFPIETTQCTNTYSTTTQQQFITPFIFDTSNLSFTSSKIDSNVYLSEDSTQTWSIIPSNSTTNCTVYIATNTQDIGLNPPYYLEVEDPNNNLNKNINITKVNKLGAVKNNIQATFMDYKGVLTPSVKVTTIKDDINALWEIEKIVAIDYLRSDFNNILDTSLEFLETLLNVALDERKILSDIIKKNLFNVAQSATSIDYFISKIDTNIPSDKDLFLLFKIKSGGHETIVNMLTKAFTQLENLYTIKSVPFNLYLTANKTGGGINRGAVTLSSFDQSKTSTNNYSQNILWKINQSVVEGFDVANFVKNISAKKNSYQPVLVSDSYPTVPNVDGVPAGWDNNYSDAWNGNYIYKGTSLSNPKQLIKVNLSDGTGINAGKGTVTVGSDVYNVKHITMDRLIADSTTSKDTLRAKLISGTSVNKGRPILVFLINGENVCGNDSENHEAYCPKIDGDEISDYRDQYQAVGIKTLDMTNGLGIPKVTLNVPNPDPCTNQNNDPVTKECAEFRYYGKAYQPGSDEWKEHSCTNKSFFENTLWTDLQSKDLAYAEDKIAQIHDRAAAGDPNYIKYCKGDNLGKYDGKFVKSSDGKEVYYIYNAISYQIPYPGACFPGDHTSSEVMTLTDDELDYVKAYRSTTPATPTSKNPNVAASCIVKAENGKSVAANVSNLHGLYFLIYNGKKYWIPKTSDCGGIAKKVTRYSKEAISAIEPTGFNVNTMEQATINSKNSEVVNFCKNQIYGQPCPIDTPYVYNANSKKGSYCCPVEPTTSLNTTYPPGTFDSCPSGTAIKCTEPPCDTNFNYTGSESDVWAITPDNVIYNKSSGSTTWNNITSWKKIKGELKWVDGTGQDYIWGINRSGNIYACKKPCYGSWSNVPGNLSQLTVDTENNIVYGITNEGSIYWQPENIIYGKWKKIQGVLKNITASGNSWVWGINKGKIYAAPKGKDSIKGIWRSVSAPLDFYILSGDNQGNETNSNVYGIASNNYIYKHNINPSTGGWTMISTGPGTSSNPNTFIEATNRVWLYVTLKNGDVYRGLKSDPPNQIRWNKLFGIFKQLSVGNLHPVKKPMLTYGANMFLRFPALSDPNNLSGRYMSGDRTGGNAKVLVNSNSSYESEYIGGYTFIASKNIYGATGSGPIKYGDVFGLKCESLGRFVSGSRGGDRGIATEDPSSTYEQNNIKAAQKALNAKPKRDTSYAWSFVSLENKPKGYPVLYGDKVMLVMSLWKGDAITAFPNSEVHNYPPKSPPTGSTNEIIIDQVWRYPFEL